MRKCAGLPANAPAIPGCLEPHTGRVERLIRSLALLEQSGSTARVLNLNAIAPRALAAAGDGHTPIFQHRRLNHSFIVKHRVRVHEQDLFAVHAASVTKIMFPLDAGNLKAGAWFAMVGQRDFDQAAEALVGAALQRGRTDRNVLEAIAALPSLDPFLLREALRRIGREPSREYFSISDADVDHMHGFVRHEIEGLVRLSGGGDGGAPSGVARLVDKLLSPAAAADLEPLRETLRLSEEDYLDGIFAWRGFLYYKWAISRIHRQLSVTVSDIHQASRKLGGAGADIQEVAVRLGRQIAGTTEEAQSLLRRYDSSYHALVHGDAPTRFRDFLLTAPDLFLKLGECAGVLQDAASYWNYIKPRFTSRISRTQLLESLVEFEECLLLGVS